MIPSFFPLSHVILPSARFLLLSTIQSSHFPKSTSLSVTMIVPSFLLLSALVSATVAAPSIKRQDASKTIQPGVVSR